MLTADGTQYHIGKRKGYSDLPCRHCGLGKVNRPRGLCWSCYYHPNVRNLYPSESKFQSKGGDHYGGHDLPADATSEAAGTEEKILALIARRAAGTSLWHPEDSQRELE